MTVRWLLPIAAVAMAWGCGADDAALEGTWRVASLQVDDQPFEIGQPLFMDITANGFNAATTCNWQSGEFGGEIMSTLMGCVGGNAAEGETYMRQAFDSKPTERDGQLVFENGDVRLVYERYDVPAPADLFAALGDPATSVGESELPAESATGSVPPNFTALVPVTSPSGEIDLFLGQLDDHICIVYGTATAMDKWCTEPRLAATQARAVDLPIYSQPLVRVALIPDRFAAAAAARTDLGSYETNVLTVNSDAPAGRYVLMADMGEELAVVIPPPWVDPMTASTSLPDS
ncbi:MAG: hypothetical protein CL424_06450 [Acidimicrobiaceae bacterium]|nr:hypothetical protein [Acidimicrobiaceae bacterium]